MAAYSALYKTTDITVEPLTGSYGKVQDALLCHHLEFIQSTSNEAIVIKGNNNHDSDKDWANLLNEICPKNDVKRAPCIYCNDNSVPVIDNANLIPIHISCFNVAMKKMKANNDYFIKLWRVKFSKLFIKYGLDYQSALYCNNLLILLSVCYTNCKYCNDNGGQYDTTNVKFNDKISPSETRGIIANMERSG